ncbi:hypothetical protein ACL6C3_05970 [Capilliphycus salinus ALCB114379]|uniref:hypothetical protein n=1 Tax=Capilliphycus salinus TaxID=2768948 RepID=UPI0039A548CE
MDSLKIVQNLTKKGAWMVYTDIMVQFGRIVTYFKKTVTKGDKFAIANSSQTPQTA